MPPESAASGTPRLRASIADRSGIPDHPLSRVTTCADEEARCSTKRVTEAQPFLLSKTDKHSQAQCSSLCRNVALLDRLPVQNVPPRLEVVGAAVLIVEIIGVLPHVVAEQGMLAVHHWTVLVRTGLERQPAVLVDRGKSPARTEQFQTVGVEIAPQFFHPAEVAVDRG